MEAFFVSVAVVTVLYSVGVLLLWGLVTYLAQFGSLYLVVLGTLAILIMLFMPNGVWGAAARRWQLQLFPTQRWLGRSESGPMPL